MRRTNVIRAISKLACSLGASLDVLAPYTVSPVLRAPARILEPEFDFTEVQLAAMDLHQRGFNVLPVRRGTKHPYMWRALAGSRIVPPREDKELRFNKRYMTYLDAFLELFKDAGVAVLTGRMSRFLSVLDCETMEASLYHREKFQQRGLNVWIVQSARGFHFWWLSGDGEIANVEPDTLIPDAEIRGNLKYCVVPPSIHPSGVIYEWLERDGELPPVLSIAQLDWLPLSKQFPKRKKYEPREPDELHYLSRANREFVRLGAPKKTRNKRLFNAACDFAGNNIPFDEARRFLLLGCDASGYDESLTRQEVEGTIKSAYSQSRTPSKKYFASDSKFVPADWMKARAFAMSHEWTNLKSSKGIVTKHTARRAFEACCERARMDDSSVFSATVRGISEIGNMETKTALRARIALVENGYIEPRGLNPHFGSALFVFPREIIGDDYIIPPTGTVSSVVISDKNSFMVLQDVFRARALTDSAGRIWEAILRCPQLQKELVKNLRLGQSTISAGLHILLSENLARREGRRWIGIPADDEKLRQIAIKKGTAGKAQRLKKRHQAEREVWVTRRLLKRKRDADKKEEK